VQPVFAFLARQKPDGSRINSLVRKIGVVRFSTHVRSRAQLVGFTIMIESGVLTVRLGSTPSTSRRLAVPLSPRPYDTTPTGTRPGTPMGTLPAQRDREHAGIGLQDRGSRGDRTQADDARPAGDLSIPFY
jgi:hypothetical protein